MKTSYGLEFDTVTEINPEWSDYDKTIAGCHLANARVVIVDTEYGQPIDNEHDLEEIYRILEKGIGTHSICAVCLVFAFKNQLTPFRRS